MITLSAFAMGVICYVLWGGADTRIGETAIQMAFASLIGICGSYVFGATWEDVSKPINPPVMEHDYNAPGRYGTTY